MPKARNANAPPSVTATFVSLFFFTLPKLSGLEMERREEALTDSETDSPGNGSPSNDRSSRA